MKTCKDCKEWRNKQRDLDYIEDYGICTGLCDFGEPDIIRVKPHEELYIMIQNKCSNDDGTIKHYEYEFCTHESFGCNRWVKS